MSHLVPASICEMEIFSRHLWDGEEDFFSESDLASQPTPTHLSWRVLIFFIVFFQIVYCIPQPSLTQKLSSLNPYDLFFPIFFQIFSPYLFFIATQMFSLRKYFPHCVSPYQSKYFFFPAIFLGYTAHDWKISVGRTYTLHNVYFVKYIFPRNRTSSDLS